MRIRINERVVIESAIMAGFKPSTDKVAGRELLDECLDFLEERNFRFDVGGSGEISGRELLGLPEIM